MKTNITEAVIILDRSGSMAHLAGSTVAGFNSLIDEQKTMPGEARISCVLFNHETALLYDRVPVENVEHMTPAQYRPSGMTALYDAIGTAVEHMIAVQKGLPEDKRADKVIFAISTDGYENSSIRFSRSAIKELIESEQRTYGWEFIFLGANIDSVSTAGSIGIDASHAVDYLADDEGAVETFKCMSEAVKMSRCCEPVTNSWKTAAESGMKKRGHKK